MKTFLYLLFIASLLFACKKETVQPEVPSVSTPTYAVNQAFTLSNISYGNNAFQKWMCTYRQIVQQTRRSL